VVMTYILFEAVEYALPVPVVRIVPGHVEAGAQVCPVIIGRVSISTISSSSNGSVAKGGGVGDGVGEGVGVGATVINSSAPISGVLAFRVSPS
jgi:hypothetical protein